MNFYTEDISNGYNWKALERAIARMMEHLGWKDINVIGGAGDKGGDVLAVRAEGNQLKSWVVQSKAVTGDRYIGPQALNEAINALSFYETNVAAVATNGEFTRTARQRQVQLEANGYTLKLWNGSFLKGLIDQMPENHAGFRDFYGREDAVEYWCCAMRPIWHFNLSKDSGRRLQKKFPHQYSLMAYRREIQKEYLLGCTRVFTVIFQELIRISSM